MNRSTIILISLLLVLGGVVFFLLPGEKERETSYTPAAIHFSIDSANVVKVGIQRSGKSVTIENIGGKWTITSPVRFPADPATIHQLLSGCANFKIGSLISSNPEKQKIFQVDTTGTMLAITDRSGKTSSMILGKMGPSFSELYFRLPSSNDVYLGQGIDSWLITKEIKDWRDKTILSRPAESIKELSYKTGTRHFDFRRDSTGWKSGIAPVDANAMNATLNTLANLKADDFIDTPLKSGSPPVTIQIQGNESATIQLSPSRPDSSQFYVRTSSSPTIFVINKFTAQQLLKPIQHQMPVLSHPSVTSTEPPKEIAPPVPKTKDQQQPTESQPVTKETRTTPPTKTAETSGISLPPRNVPPTTSKESAPSQPKPATPTETTSKAAPSTPPANSRVESTSPQTAGDEEGDLTVYTVKRGETMTTIAKKFNVTTEQILKWNLLKSISVKPGQELYIYQIKK